MPANTRGETKESWKLSMPLVIVYTISKDNLENCWMVDEVIELQNQELSLHRSGKHVITLGLDDYKNGLCVIDPSDDEDAPEISLNDIVRQLDS